MSFNAKSSFTALTANILVAGQTVGALQSLKIDDNYNTIRVGQIGSPLDIVHIPGRVQVNLSARRMVVNQDLVMTYLRPALAANADATNAAIAENAANANLTPSQRTALDATTVNNFLANAKFANFSGPAALNANRYYNFIFDIEVKDSEGTVVYLIKDCDVVSRSVTIDQGSIVISEDVTIFGMYVDYQPGVNSSLPGIS